MSNTNPAFKHIRVTNRDIATRLHHVRIQIREKLGCNRVPGSQLTLDALLHMWEQVSLNLPSVGNDVMSDWRTPIVGYPNSTRVNPGSFTSEPPSREEMVRDSEASHPGASSL